MKLSIDRSKNWCNLYIIPHWNTTRNFRSLAYQYTSRIFFYFSSFYHINECNDKCQHISILLAKIDYITEIAPSKMSHVVLFAKIFRDKYLLINMSWCIPKVALHNNYLISDFSLINKRGFELYSCSHILIRFLSTYRCYRRMQLELPQCFFV